MSRAEEAVFEQLLPSPEVPAGADMADESTESIARTNGFYFNNLRPVLLAGTFPRRKWVEWLCRPPCLGSRWPPFSTKAAAPTCHMTTYPLTY
jgi:hypothetical protein